jgi:hypothetical protein
MPRLPRLAHPAGLLPLALATALGLAGASPLLAQGGSPATQQPAQGGAGLSVAEARAAAERILRAVQSGDAERRYSQFSDELKAVSSPAMVAATMRTQPKLLSWTLLSVRSGLNTTTVEAALRTSAGTRDLFLVLNPKGQLAGYHLDLTDEKAASVAAAFIRALSSGQYITARSYLILPMQAELSAATLQTRWQGLQRLTGNFVRVRRVVEAENSAEGRLVLVNTEFNRLTDNLFVILNTNNEIIGVDFPHESAVSR